MTVKEELHHLVDALGDDDAEDAVDYLRWLLSETDTLTEKELEDVRRGRKEIARGEYVTLDELRRHLGL